MHVNAPAGNPPRRILPTPRHTGRTMRIYQDVLDRRRECRCALGELAALSSSAPCNGWLLGKAGWVYESPN